MPIIGRLREVTSNTHYAPSLLRLQVLELFLQPPPWSFLASRTLRFSLKNSFGLRLLGIILRFLAVPLNSYFIFYL